MTEIAVPGARWSSVYRSLSGAGRSTWDMPTVLWGRKGAQVSFIGHGVGVEIDEYPVYSKGL